LTLFLFSPLDFEFVSDFVLRISDLTYSQRLFQSGTPFAVHPSSHFGRPSGRFTLSRILIVDDVPVSRTAMSRLLQNEGYETDTARNGAEGLVRIKQNLPDLILLDQMMPEVDGLTFLAGIRRFPKWKNLPVIMLTGVKDRGCHMKAQTLGVKAFLEKGEYTTIKLLEYVQKHVTAASTIAAK
jgi:CheY-like chemotaxis protein